MELKKFFATNKQAEEEGVWVDVDTETKILVARAGNEKYKKIMQMKLTPYKQAVRQGILPEELAKKFLVEAMAESVLLGWKGFKEGGVDVPYSKETAIRILTDYPDFQQFISSVADSVELYRQEEEAEAVKN